ncbi:MAG: class I SAM-dependent methyltransferase [Halobacteriales archaeon]|nr:class I SAM-dependent methyltransferase [Halobacteriales archaeon]
MNVPGSKPKRRLRTALVSPRKPTPNIDLYSQLDGDYHRLVRSKFYYGHIARTEERHFRNALRALPKGAAVLDVGCGDAHFALLAAATGQGFQVAAVDPAPGMRHAAREAARRRNLDISVQDGDVLALPFPDGSFDFVLCVGSVINHCQTPAAGLAELGRVLRPGGFLMLDLENQETFERDGGKPLAVAGGDNSSPVYEWSFLVDGTERLVTLSLIGHHQVVGALASQAMRVVSRSGIHILTRPFPFTNESAHFVERKPVPRGLRMLARIDALLARLPVAISRSGVELVLCRKDPPTPKRSDSNLV